MNFDTRTVVVAAIAVIVAIVAYMLILSDNGPAPQATAPEASPPAATPAAVPPAQPKTP